MKNKVKQSAANLQSDVTYVQKDNTFDILAGNMANIQREHLVLIQKHGQNMPTE